MSHADRHINKVRNLTERWSVSTKFGDSRTNNLTSNVLEQPLNSKITHDEVIYVSSDDEEFVDVNVKTDISNDGLKIYCSICKKKKIYNHVCSMYNTDFSTCLVPNCNILSRSVGDFTAHYRQHYGMPTGVRICRHCYKENKMPERDNCDYHINCQTLNLFKCNACNIVFKSMTEFATHKLQAHNGRLLNSSGNYLCFYCEKSSPDLMTINGHIKHCRDNQFKSAERNETKNEMQLTKLEAEENQTELLIDNKEAKKVIEQTRENKKLLLRTSQLSLFTCLKPSCNLIFKYFPTFKIHHREHFEIGNKLMCWQCCTPFPSKSSLRNHQLIGHCHTLGMFKCYECFEQYEDIERLSIHKFITHNGILQSQRKNKKAVPCPTCKIEININDLRNHLIQGECHDSKIAPKPILVKRKTWCSRKCTICGKVCLTAALLSSHIKLHKPNFTK